MVPPPVRHLLGHVGYPIPHEHAQGLGSQLRCHIEGAGHGLFADALESAVAVLGQNQNRRCHGQPLCIGGLQHLGLEVENEFCTVYCVALDEHPIAQSSRLLLVTAGRASQTGFEWGDEEHHTVKNWGGPPTVIEPVSGTAVLRGLAGAKRLVVRPLAGEGRPLSHVVLDAPEDGQAWRISIGNPATTWYMIEVER